MVSGGLEQLDVLSNEILELRRANVQLLEGQRLSSTGSFTSDLQRDVNVWSDEFYRIFDIDMHTHPAVAEVRARVHPEDLDLFDGEMARAHSGGDGDFAFRIVTRTGEVRHVRGYARLAEEVDGRPLFMGAVQDITASKMSEERIAARERELREAYNFLEEAQKISKTGSFAWNLSSDERVWSAEMERIFEAGTPTSPWSASLVLVHPTDRNVVEGFIEEARNGRDYAGEFRLVMSDGRLKNIRTVGRRIADGHESMFIVTGQDVTELRRGEEALSQVRTKLAHLARVSALGTLSASITHEVSQPLAGILNNVNASIRMLAAVPPDVEKATLASQRTLRDANRAADVIRRLRALFTRKPPSVDLVDLNEAARELVTLFESEFRRRLIGVDLCLEAGLPNVSGDRTELQQVILNLIFNAVDAIAAGGGDRGKIVIATSSTSEVVTFSIIDSGVGLPSDGIDQIFDAFYTTRDTGMGIGLAVGRTIVEGLGGRITASNNQGNGATFAFSLPRCEQTSNLRKDSQHAE